VKTLACLLLLVAPAVVRAADGDLDPAFGIDGIALAGTIREDRPFAVATDGEGRLMVAASGEADVSTILVIYRFTPDGQLDPVFDDDGIRAVSFTFGGETTLYPSDLAIQPDGRIVVAGIAAAGAARAGVLVRMMSDGALDPSFDGDGIFVLAPTGQNHRFLDVELRPGGNLVVLDGYDNTVDDDVTAIVELDSSGVVVGFVALDLFPTSNDLPTKLLLEGDGRMLVAARGILPDPNEVVLVRWNPDYSLDTTFAGDGIGHYPFASGVAHVDVDRLEDGRYVLGVGKDALLTLDWLLPNGSSDPAACTQFPFCAFIGFQSFEGLVAQADGKVLAVGENGASEDLRVGRYLESGTGDPSFGGSGLRDVDCAAGAGTSEDWAGALAISGGRAVALGWLVGPPEDDAVCVAQLTSQLIFRHGFEGGDFRGWSSAP
jgi:uncharacterized delta-60 repeat protein